MSLRTISLLVVCTTLFFLCACAKQAPTPATHAKTTPKEFSVETTVIGIDQFDGGEVWGINTEHGTYVVGPEVPGGIKTTIYEEIMDARGQMITIRFQDVSANGKIIAHRRATALIIQEKEYRLDY